MQLLDSSPIRYAHSKYVHKCGLHLPVRRAAAFPPCSSLQGCTSAACMHMEHCPVALMAVRSIAYNCIVWSSLCAQTIAVASHIAPRRNRRNEDVQRLLELHVGTCLARRLLVKLGKTRLKAASITFDVHRSSATKQGIEKRKHDPVRPGFTSAGV